MYTSLDPQTQRAVGVKYLLNGKVRSQLVRSRWRRRKRAPLLLFPLPSLAVFSGAHWARQSPPWTLTRSLMLYEEPEKQAGTAGSRTGQKSIPPSAGVGGGGGELGGYALVRGKSSSESWETGVLMGYGDLERGLAFPELLGGECRRGRPPSGVGTEKASSSEPPTHYLELRITLPPPSLRPQMLQNAGQGREGGSWWEDMLFPTRERQYLQ